MSLTVRLNGSNYVSDKTRAAFEKALADGRQVQLASHAQENDHEPKNGNGHNGGNGNGDSRTPDASHLPSTETLMRITDQPTHIEQEQPLMNKTPDYARLFESLERGLDQSYEHQTQTLRVHEQYLSYQSNYAALFTQLLQQQGAIFSAGHTDPQQAALAAQVLDNLSHSLARFHDLQTETLNVHKQFLSQQAEYSQAHVEILRQQQTLTTGESRSDNPGSGNGNGHGEVHSASHDLHHSQTHRTHAHGNGHNGNGNGHHSLATPMPAPVRPMMTEKPTSPTLPLARPTAPVVRPVTLPAQPIVAPARTERVEAEVRVVPAPVPQPPAAAPSASGAFDAQSLTQSLLAIVSDKTGYPADMLDLTMDMEADLGIDSIKRVEILGALQERHPGLPKIEPQALAELRTLAQIVEHVRTTLGAPASKVLAERHSELSAESRPAQGDTPAAPPVLEAEALTQSLLAIVSEKTGYPADMLDLTMDMEADLGIDSIKRVEILGALQERHPGLPKIEPQALAELRTLGQIVNYIQTGPDSKKA